MNALVILGLTLLSLAWFVAGYHAVKNWWPKDGYHQFNQGARVVACVASFVGPIPHLISWGLPKSQAKK